MMFLSKQDPIVDIKELLYARLQDATGDERVFLLYVIDMIERS